LLLSGASLLRDCLIAAARWWRGEAMQRYLSLPAPLAFRLYLRMLLFTIERLRNWLNL